MGHIRFGKMPKTRNWAQVAQLLSDDSADVSAIASSTINAAREAFDNLANDIGLQSAFWTLTQITLRAREKDFIADLSKVGLDISGVTDRFQLIAKVSEYIRDRIQASGKQTIFSEIARLSLASVLTNRLAKETSSLFGPSIDDLRNTFKQLSTKKNFASLSKDYFAELLRRSLQYFVSMEICNHVGPSRRFKDINSLSDFDEALAIYCHQSARIVEEFSGGWYSKTEYEKGIGFNEVRGFIHVAMKKLRQEISGEATENETYTHPL